MTSKVAYIKELREMGACQEALDWCQAYPTPDEAWQACKRGDWMLWVLGREISPNSPEHKRLVFTTCQCARLALRYVPEGEERPRQAIEIAEAWTRGDATIEAVRSAAQAAAQAATYAAAHAASDATQAAVYYATYAAYAAQATYAVTYDSDAASHAIYAAFFTSLEESANIVRQSFPHPPKSAVGVA